MKMISAKFIDHVTSLGPLHKMAESEKRHCGMRCMTVLMMS